MMAQGILTSISGGLSSADLLKLKHYVIETLTRELESDSVPLAQREPVIRQKLTDIFSRLGSKVPESIRQQITQDSLDDLLGYGPIQPLLDDPDVSEVMVNGPKKVYVEKKGHLVKTGVTFEDNDHVLKIIERIILPLGRRVDADSPTVDARLPDGSRVNAVILPVSIDGPSITIRKFRKDKLSMQQLIDFGSITAPMAEFLRACVIARLNIVISGGTGSGKTTLLNVMSGSIPEDERIITIEDAAELQLQQDHIVRLETKAANLDGKGIVTIRDLVRNALRMRPDRIVVGECRGGESLDMLQAMNTGHDGSLTTVHANTPRDVISRLETMVLMSGMDLPGRAIREQIAAAVDLIAHEARLSDGSRRITKITEVLGLEGNQIVMQDIFEYKQTGLDAQGRIEGYFTATGSVPTFLENLATRGLSIDHSIFTPAKEEPRG